MSRSLLPLASLLALSACSPSVDLHLRSELKADASGLVLEDGARLGDAAMAGQICVVDTVAGEVVADTNLAEGHERVFDAHDGLTLAADEHGSLYEISTAGTGQSLPWSVEDAVDGKLLDDGVVALFPTDTGCGVAFSTSTGDVGWDVQADCDGHDGELAVDRTLGTAWIADGTSLTRVTADGSVTSFDLDADLVAWDAKDGLAIAARQGDDLVRAVKEDGTIAWAVRLGGPVFDLDAAASAGIVVTSVVERHGGEIAVLDGVGGDEIVSHEVPTVPTVTVSSDGLSLGLLTPGTVYFYDVDPNAMPLDTPTTEQVQDLRGIGGGVLVGTATFGAMIILD